MRRFFLRSRVIKALYIPTSVAIVYYTLDKFITAMDTAKSSSALFKSVMYHLRNDQKAIDLLGKGIKRADGSRWIYGEVNMITGKADLKFEVQGEHSKAEVRFKGHRDDEGDWLSTDYRLISGDKVIEF